MSQAWNQTPAARLERHTTRREAESKLEKRSARIHHPGRGSRPVRRDGRVPQPEPLAAGAHRRAESGSVPQRKGHVPQADRRAPRPAGVSPRPVADTRRQRRPGLPVEPEAANERRDPTRAEHLGSPAATLRSPQGRKMLRCHGRHRGTAALGALPDGPDHVVGCMQPERAHDECDL